MNILVISGGSGNDALVTGIKKVYPESNVNVLVNAYDSGKSTGICRNITNTLGVSDIRKNHIRMYKAVTPNPNQCFIEFYESRYDLTKGNELNEVLLRLNEWNMNGLAEYAVRFFERSESQNYDYKNFNISNIIYSEMYAEHGYEATNELFCQVLGLRDFVLLNSFDNIFIKALTESGKTIEDEGDIVEYGNADDPIVKLSYDFKGEGEPQKLNLKAVDAIYDADLIIISTGTFWSSIYPTLDYYDLYKYINESKAKKIWAVNCEQDKDCFGVGSNKMIEILTNLGLDLKQFVILENTDANILLKEPNEEYNIVYESMGNNDGKHDGDKYAKAILKIFYNVKPLEEYDRIIFDFDDTLWSRDYEKDKDLLTYSRDNIKLVNELKEKGCIISGNSYESISKKLSTIFGGSLKDFDIDIWADANSALFKNNERVSIIPEIMITGNTENLVRHLNQYYGLECKKNDENYTSCLKIKPLSPLDQALLTNYLNDYILGATGMGYCVAKATGRTTVDIVHKSNTKIAALQNMDVDFRNVLYIGDETDVGNDADIAGICGSSIRTLSVRETNAILRLLLNKG